MSCLFLASRRHGGERVDTLQEVGEQRCRDGHLCALEDRLPGVGYDPGSYLDELELNAPERPVGNQLRQGEPPDEVSNVGIIKNGRLL
jgi:hypothetical protein